ncbi:MAG: hypothetical protein QW230_04980 [Thermofilum sp.]
MIRRGFHIVTTYVMVAAERAAIEARTRIARFWKVSPVLAAEAWLKPTYSFDPAANSGWAPGQASYEGCSRHLAIEDPTALVPDEPLAPAGVTEFRGYSE